MFSTVSASKQAIKLTPVSLNRVQEQPAIANNMLVFKILLDAFRGASVLPTLPGLVYFLFY